MEQIPPVSILYHITGWFLAKPAVCSFNVAPFKDTVEYLIRAAHLVHVGAVGTVPLRAVRTGPTLCSLGRDCAGHPRVAGVGHAGRTRRQPSHPWGESAGAWRACWKREHVVATGLRVCVTNTLTTGLTLHHRVFQEDNFFNLEKKMIKTCYFECCELYYIFIIYYMWLLVR